MWPRGRAVLGRAVLGRAVLGRAVLSSLRRWTGKQQVTRLESGTSRLKAEQTGCILGSLMRPVADT